MRKDTRLSLLILSAFLLVGLLAALGQYRWDNKYTSALSGGWGFNVLQSDPEQPAWLVDGWEFYPGELLSPEDFAAGRQAEGTPTPGSTRTSAHSSAVPTARRPTASCWRTPARAWS